VQAPFDIPFSQHSLCRFPSVKLRPQNAICQDIFGSRWRTGDRHEIKIASPNAACIEKARGMINAIVAEPEAGKIYNGRWSRSWISALS